MSKYFYSNKYFKKQSCVPLQISDRLDLSSDIFSKRLKVTMEYVCWLESLQ